MIELSKVKYDKNLRFLSTEKLRNILKDMYENAPSGYKVTMIHLFGINYANELKNNKQLKDISFAATGYSSYATEISKGIKLAKLFDYEMIIQKKLLKEKLVKKNGTKFENI